jgi:uncharacterized protein (DUF305 family)
MSDARFIDSSIEYNEDVIFLSQKALTRATDAKLKELAQQMEEDNSGMLYTMEQLQTAGSGTSKRTVANNPTRKAAIINNTLSQVSGGAYDTLWVANLLAMHQFRYDQLVAAKENVRNPQLRMAITEAISPTKKSLTQLKALQKYFVKMEIQRKKLEAAQEKEAAQQRKSK